MREASNQWKFSLREHLWLLFQYFIILPIRWYRSHIRVWGSGNQRCKVCGQTTGYCFQVPNDVWAAVVPRRWVGLVVCLWCFDRFAKEREVDYSTSLSDMIFIGEKGNFHLEITHRQDLLD